MTSLVDTWEKSRVLGYTPNMIVFDGPDGCGKSTIAKAVADSLVKDGYKCSYTRNPGGTQMAEKIREVLLSGKELPSPLIMFNLFAAALQCSLNMIKENKDTLFIVDRYYLSTIVYQYLVPRSDPKIVGSKFTEVNYLQTLIKYYMLNNIWFRPCIMFIINRPYEECYKAAMQTKNVFEEQGEVYFQRVYDTYKKFFLNVCEDEMVIRVNNNNSIPIEYTVEDCVDLIKNKIPSIQTFIYKGNLNYDAIHS